jgi:hypothetical protein
LSVLKTDTVSTQIFPGNINIKINLLWLGGDLWIKINILENEEIQGGRREESDTNTTRLRPRFRNTEESS